MSQLGSSVEGDGGLRWRGSVDGFRAVWERRALVVEKAGGKESEFQLSVSTERYPTRAGLGPIPSVCSMRRCPRGNSRGSRRIR